MTDFAVYCRKSCQRVTIMRKSTVFAAFLALPFAQQAPAQDWTAVPNELVMVAPTNELVNRGVLMWRLVHATILPGKEFTDIRIRFIGQPPPGIEPCADSPADSATECFPNAMGRLDFRLRNQPTGAPDDAAAAISLGGAATIDKASLDLAYLVSPTGLFAGQDLTITARDGGWSITSSEDFYGDTLWKPMSLRDTAQTVAFAANLGLSLHQIGDCVIDQVIAAQDDPSPQANALRANIAERATYWLLPPAAQNDWTDQRRLRHVALGLLAGEENIPQTPADALRIEYLAELVREHGDAFLTRDYEKLRLAAEYEQRLTAAAIRLGDLTPAYICENLLAP